MPSPFSFTCCGGLLFLRVPFVGYTRSTEVYIFLFGFSFLLLFLLMKSLNRAFRRSRSKSSAASSAFSLALVFIVPILLAALANYIYGLDQQLKDYGSYLRQSILASYADDNTLKIGYDSFVESFVDKSGVLSWAREPHVVSVLSPEEVSSVVSLVLSHRADFYHIDHLAFALPFFTHGPYWGYHHFTSSHNHNTAAPRPSNSNVLSSTFTSYQAAVEKSKSSMLQDFPLLYSRVLSALKSSLHASSVSFLPGLGLPGFHIIDSHFAWSSPLFRFHTDESFSTLMSDVVNGYAAESANDAAALPTAAAEMTSGGKCDERSRISFTLALAMPAPSSGLDYIDFSPSRDDGPASGGRCAFKGDEKFRCHVKKRQVYEVGKMVIHSGLMVHSIGHWDFLDAEKPRITMQGFGFKCFDDDWFVYW